MTKKKMINKALLIVGSAILVGFLGFALILSFAHPIWETPVHGRPKGLSLHRGGKRGIKSDNNTGTSRGSLQ